MKSSDEIFLLILQKNLNGTFLFSLKRLWHNEDVPDCSHVPDVFGSMEFSDVASVFEESPLDLNTQRTKQVCKDVVLVSYRKNIALNPEIYFSLYIVLTPYFSI